MSCLGGLSMENRFSHLGQLDGLLIITAILMIIIIFCWYLVSYEVVVLVFV